MLWQRAGTDGWTGKRPKCDLRRVWLLYRLVYSRTWGVSHRGARHIHTSAVCGDCVAVSRVEGALLVVLAVADRSTNTQGRDTVPQPERQPRRELGPFGFYHTMGKRTLAGGQEQWLRRGPARWLCRSELEARTITAWVGREAVGVGRAGSDIEVLGLKVWFEMWDVVGHAGWSSMRRDCGSGDKED